MNWNQSMEARLQPVLVVMLFIANAKRDHGTQNGDRGMQRIAQQKKCITKQASGAPELATVRRLTNLNIKAMLSDVGAWLNKME